MQEERSPDEVTGEEELEEEEMEEIDTPYWEYPDRLEPYVMAGEFSENEHHFLAWANRLPEDFPKLKALATQGRVADPLELAQELVRAAKRVDSPGVGLAVDSLSDELVWHLANWDLEHFPEPDPAVFVIFE